jgi:hypothetical protein
MKSSFWRSRHRSRHSGEARISVFAFVAPLHLQENRCKPHRINLLSATPGGSIFCRHHPRQSLFFTPNPYVLNILSVTSMQSIFWPATPSATIDSKQLAPKSFIM